MYYDESHSCEKLSAAGASLVVVLVAEAAVA